MSHAASPSTTHDLAAGEPRRVWFVTGAGRGLGRAFTEAALGAGDRVVATARRPEMLDDLAARHPAALHAVGLDVTDRAGVMAAVDEAIAWGGRLDVVVNNAGYGFVGAAEEASEAEARAIIDTNLLGPLWVSQAVAPHLRRQGSGHIVQISTTGAVGTMPTFGLYNASKWGLEGFSEAMAAELAPFGVRVTIAELGGFATDWAGASMAFARPVDAYDDLRTSLFGSPEVPWPGVGEGEASSGAINDETDAQPEAEATPQEAPGDAPPELAARALLDHLAREEGPLRLLIGDDAPEHVALALAARRDDYGRDPRFTWPGREA